MSCDGFFMHTLWSSQGWIMFDGVMKKKSSSYTNYAHITLVQ